ncbi:PstS family phosphate ABC transporter substrate-binding protein [Dyadobacter sp. CY356]|uniref:PstS family phosphate ABC transporter substrate-binding protein n=1 Tax=Dyadobacter sp. CY356 TaxID=2906442 RepID=UPI001F3A9D4F|nr:substrate-binding domain-containing protein [Dyadobacter sp. CY356]MCF0056540.1 substrate-binding domain-containing protein [Dyadobacter sp. CY356]
MKYPISAGIGIFLCILILASGCSKTSSKERDNPVQGTITIAADESFKPLVDALTKAYEGIYPKAHFNVVYKPEQEAILELLKDSVRLVFATRQLSENEISMVRQQEGIQKAHHIALDGLALVVNGGNADSLITMDEVKSIVEGKITDWSQLKGSNLEGPITLVFDSANSSNLNFVMSKFNLKSIQKLRITSAGSNSKVIDEIKKNPLSLGFIGVNWISDGHDALARELSKGIRVLGVSKNPNPASIQEYYQPFQNGLELKNYPLSRDVYIIIREGYAGLGSGMVNYIARDVGGLIIQKMGLIPTVVYPRELEIRTGQNL